MKPALSFILLLLACLACGPHATAQGPYVKKWDRTLGSSSGDPQVESLEGFDHPTNKNSLVICPRFDQSYGLYISSDTYTGFNCNKHSTNLGGTSDIWLISLDDQGNLIWEKSFGTNGHDVNSLLGTKDSSVLLLFVGHGTAGTVSEPPLGVCYDICLGFIDFSGVLKQDFRLGGYYSEIIQGVVLRSTEVILYSRITHKEVTVKRVNMISEPPRDDPTLPEVIGIDETQSIRRTDIWLISIDEQGNKLWDKRLGGLASDRPTDVVATPDGGLLVGGVTDSPVSSEVTQPPLGRSDVWLIKTDAQGWPQWDVRLGGSDRDTVHQIIPLESGRHLLVCSSKSPPGPGKAAPLIGGHDVWLVEIDERGRRLREWTIGGTGDERHPRLVRRPEGGWLLACWSKSGVSGQRTVPRKGSDDIWVVGLDDAFQVQWDQCLGGDRFEMLAAMQPTPDGDFVLLAMSTSDRSFDKSEDHCPGARTGDLWVVKIGPAQPLAYVDLRLELQNLEQSVILNWTRSEERSVLSYTVERSADLKRWRDVGRVDVGLPGMGGAGSHRYEDSQPLAGVSYYRLRIEEMGGRQSYSEIREVRRPSGLGGVGVDLQLQPVPFGDRLRVVGRWEEPHRLRIRTLTGSAVGQVDLPAGEVDQQLDTSDWAAGVYLVEVWRGLRRVDVRRVLKL